MKKLGFVPKLQAAGEKNQDGNDGRYLVSERRSSVLECGGKRSATLLCESEKRLRQPMDARKRCRRGEASLSPLCPRTPRRWRGCGKPLAFLGLSFVPSTKLISRSEMATLLRLMGAGWRGRHHLFKASSKLKSWFVSIVHAASSGFGSFASTGDSPTFRSASASAAFFE